VMGEYKISSADVAIRCDATIDDLIDILEAKSRSYIPVIYALNKIDSISIEELDLIYRIPNACPISSEHGWNIDELLEQMWDKLQLRRIYTKPKGKSPDYNTPVVLRKSACSVEDFVGYATITGRHLLKMSVQCYPQNNRGGIQTCDCVRTISKASTAEGRPLSRACR